MPDPEECLKAHRTMKMTQQLLMSHKFHLLPAPTMEDIYRNADVDEDSYHRKFIVIPVKTGESFLPENFSMPS